MVVQERDVFGAGGEDAGHDDEDVLIGRRHPFGVLDPRVAHADAGGHFRPGKAIGDRPARAVGGAADASARSTPRWASCTDRACGTPPLGALIR
jgi:hypothetical protein